jgi:hypothetical protein
MSGIRKTRFETVALVVAGALVFGIAGCGEDDFKNKPRPAVALQLTGVVQPDKVSVQPKKFGGGPVLITIANQTPDAHTVTLEGGEIREVVGPIQPQDTATIQQTLREGIYEVRAGSEEAVPKEIEPARLDVGPDRPDSSGEPLLP